MIHLAVGRLEVDWGKNNFFTNHGALFQPSDLKLVPSYYAGDNLELDSPICFALCARDGVHERRIILRSIPVVR